MFVRIFFKVFGFVCLVLVIIGDGSIVSILSRVVEVFYIDFDFVGMMKRSV